MKILFKCILGLIVINSGASAQILWQPYRAPMPVEFSDVVSVRDVNLDGHPDLITGREVAWYKNNGAGNFEIQIVDPDAFARSNLDAADFDSDGDMDLVGNLAINSQNVMLVYENLGAETFRKRIIRTGLNQSGFFTYLYDFDQDGDIDILSNNYESQNSEWAYFENVGNLNFGFRILYQSPTTRYQNLIITDFDGDNDPDIMGVGTELVFFENDGQENFSARDTIAVDIDNRDKVAHGDIDNDGDIDVLVTGRITSQNLLLYTNDGSANFTMDIIDALPSFINNFEMIDTDSDGDMDILATGESHLLYENDGNGNFQVDSLSLPFYSTQAAAADFDSDGRIDIVFHGSTFGWLKNKGGNDFDYKVIAGRNYPLFLHTADTDGDGDLDIFASYTDMDYSQLTVYKNDGSGRFSPDHFYYSKTDLDKIEIVDLDNDSDMDFISYSGGDVSLFENEGSNNFTQRIISPSGFGIISGISDFNNDGYKDILYRDLGAVRSELSLYLNDGSNQFTPQLILDDPDRRIDLAFHSDFDRDGDIDILLFWGITGSPDGMFLYSNDGSGNFSDSLLAYISSPFTIQTEDMDLDGDIDFVYSKHEIFWEENLNNTQFIQRPITTINLRGAEFKIADLDSDGDPDIAQILRTPVNTWIVGWQENNGNGAFTYRELVNINKNHAFLFVEDFTGNGEKDLLMIEYPGLGASGGSSANFLIFENLGPSTPISSNEQIVPQELLLHQNYPNPFNPTTTIAFDLSVASNVNLTVYDIQGREVATLLNEPRVPGYHEVDFDAAKLSSGVYFYRLEAGVFSETRKMLLIR